MAKKTPSSETKQKKIDSPASAKTKVSAAVLDTAKTVKSKAKQEKPKSEAVLSAKPGLNPLPPDLPESSVTAASSKSDASPTKPQETSKPVEPKSAPADAATKKSFSGRKQAGAEAASVAAETTAEAAEVKSPPEPTPIPVEPDRLVEAEFVARQPPLPLEEFEDAADKLELLREVEAQFDELSLNDDRIADEAPRIEETEILHEPEPAIEPEPFHFQAPEPEYQPQGPVIPSMYIVQITPEIAPAAKVGGLADVVFGLSNELELRGNHVEIILPKYDCLRYDHIWGLCETYNDLWVPWFGGAIHCTVFFGFVHGRKCFFIEPHSADNFFNRGCIYGFKDDALRFAFFTRAALEFMWKTGKNPEIIHCHDWQTALVPVLLYEIYQHLGLRHPRVCFTIHNFKHQGVVGAQLLHATGLNRPEFYFHYDRMRDNKNPHALNLMKAGLVYSNFTTTVSPRHAIEAKDQGQGFGLEPTLHIHHSKFGGVVNGVDYSFWNPEIDPLIPVHYTADCIEGKYENKRALRQRLMLADNEKPIVAFVGRLDPQKGLELVRHALFYTLQRGGQFVLLGSGPEAQINNYFWSLKHQLNDNPDCHIEVGFNEELSHLIYAGSDIMVVPSRFEPCGLTQLISMRYGSIPVAREVGGLADTVVDKDFSWKPLHERNGYLFRDYDGPGLESALGRAISCYYEYPEHFRELIKNAMRYDYSWKNPGQDYLNIYDYIRDK
ncbi:MAG: glycogen synthase GlgA [Methylococcaceae bacterium]|nr:glycogen synthase GlgA [Methylococcaceae bacterium]